MWLCCWLTVCQRLEPPGRGPAGRQVGHGGLDAGLVLFQRFLERSGQVTRLSGRQLQTAGHQTPRVRPAAWKQTEGHECFWDTAADSQLRKRRSSAWVILILISVMNHFCGRKDFQGQKQKWNIRVGHIFSGSGFSWMKLRFVGFGFQFRIFTETCSFTEFRKLESLFHVKIKSTSTQILWYLKFPGHVYIHRHDDQFRVWSTWYRRFIKKN